MPTLPQRVGEHVHRRCNAYSGLTPDDGSVRPVRGRAGRNLRIANLSRVIYATPDGHELHLDVFQPDARRSERAPFVLWLHGGGWMSGDRTRGTERLQYLLEAGYVCASADYRLSQQALFPACLEDCQAAIRYIREHAIEWGVDPNSIGVWGASAGGHLAALLGVTADVQAVCGWYAPSDLTRMNDFPPGVVPHFEHRLDALSCEGRLLGGAVADRLELAARANPITYIQPGGKLPPFLLMHGAADTAVPYVSSELLHAALRAAGGRQHALHHPRRRSQRRRLVRRPPHGGPRLLRLAPPRESH